MTTLTPNREAFLKVHGRAYAFSFLTIHGTPQFEAEMAAAADFYARHVDAEEWAERAAVYEFEAKQPRATAEASAYWEMFEKTYEAKRPELAALYLAAGGVFDAA